MAVEYPHVGAPNGPRPVIHLGEHVEVEFHPQALELIVEYKDTYYGDWVEEYVEITDEALELMYNTRKQQLAEASEKTKED